MQRHISINRPSRQVFDYVKLLRNQDSYNKWTMADPAMKKVYTGTDGTPGFTYTWDGNKKAGKGIQVIDKVEEGNRISWNLTFIRPFSGKAVSDMVTIPAAASQTNLTWTFNGKMKYPSNFMLLFINMDDLLGKDLDTSLTNLKTVMEK